jgi:hypothetical protein
MSVLSFVLASDDRLLDRVVGWRPPLGARHMLPRREPATAGSNRGRGHPRRVERPACASQQASWRAARQRPARVREAPRRPAPCDRVRSASFDMGPLAWFPLRSLSFPPVRINAFAIGA